MVLQSENVHNFEVYLQKIKLSFEKLKFRATFRHLDWKTYFDVLPVWDFV